MTQSSSGHSSGLRRTHAEQHITVAAVKVRDGFFVRGGRGRIAVCLGERGGCFPREEGQERWESPVDEEGPVSRTAVEGGMALVDSSCDAMLRGCLLVFYQEAIRRIFEWDMGRCVSILCEGLGLR
jgi:hypothetical protein